MEILEEGDLWQMVNDFIETESASPADAASKQQSVSLLNQRSRSFQLKEILNTKKTDEEARVLEIVTMTHMPNKMELLKKPTKLKRWLVTCLLRNGSGGFSASLCRTCWPTSSSCPSGEYEYVDIIIEGEGAGHNEEDEQQQTRRLILDVDFKSQFEVARPTKSYSELCSNLPQIFVGSEEKLRKVISVMCSAAEESMRQRGLHVPPWRRSAYMLSKWFSDSITRDSLEDEANVVGNDQKKLRDHHRRVSNNDQWADDASSVIVVFGTKKKPLNKIDETARRRRVTAAAPAGSGYFSNWSINCC